MTYIIYFDWAAVIVYGIIFINLAFKKSVRTRASKMFMALLYVAALATLFDMVSSYLMPYARSIPMPVNYLINIIYYLTFNATAPVYLAYILTLTGKLNADRRRQLFFIFAPYFLSAILIITTPFTQSVFHFDANGAYGHGIALYALYAIAEGYLVAALIIAARNSRLLTKEQTFSTYFYIAGNILTVFVQMLMPNLLIAQFAVSVSVLLIHLTLQNPEDYYDSSAGLLNRRAFIAVLNEKIDGGKALDVVALRISELGYLNNTLGIESAEKILQQITRELKKLSGQAELFLLAHDQYAFLADADKEIYDSIPSRLTELFSAPVEYQGLSVPLTAPTCCVSCPTTVRAAEDVISVIDYYLNIKTASAVGSVMWAEKEVLEEYTREEKLLNILREAVANEGFTVLYQPIYSVADDAFTEAEALVRLKSTGDIGFVGPDEFIPLAEKNGLIQEIGRIVLRQVCQFLRESAPRTLRHINVNLSVVQCMQNDLHESLTDVIDSYGVDHELITLEITETSAANSAETLKHNMQKLIANGIGFAMDDYGSGFSGAGYLIDYPFAIVKLDKHIVWEAFKDKRAMSVLKNTINMIKEMDMDIVAEGVETREQADTLLDMGCDLLQGFLFSRPITGEKLVRFLS